MVNSNFEKQLKKAFAPLLVATLALWLLYVFRFLVDLNEIQVFISGSGYLAPAMYFLIYTVLVSFGFPSAVLTIMAGALFGVFNGFIIDFVASMFTASITYFAAYLFKERFERYVRSSRRGVKIIDFLNDKAENQGFTNTLLLRFSFVPFIVISYAAGILKNVKFYEFFFATVISNAIFGFLIVYLGNSFLEGEGVWVSIGLFTLVLLFVITYRKVSKN